MQPVVEGDQYRFTVKMGKPPESAKGGTTAGKRVAFICLLSESPIDYNYIRGEGRGAWNGIEQAAEKRIRSERRGAWTFE